MANFNIEIELNYNAGIVSEIESRVEKALERSAIIIESKAIQKAPVDTGELRNSITHEVAYPEAVVGSNLEYAPYVEVGTGIYSTKGNGRQTPWKYQNPRTGEWVTTVGQHAQPFLEPAMNESRADIIKEFEGII